MLQSASVSSADTSGKRGSLQTLKQEVPNRAGTLIISFFRCAQTRPPTKPHCSLIRQGLDASREKRQAKKEKRQAHKEKKTRIQNDVSLKHNVSQIVLKPASGSQQQ